MTYTRKDYTRKDLHKKRPTQEKTYTRKYLNIHKKRKDLYQRATQGTIKSLQEKPYTRKDPHKK
jgi:hypothetical protein